MFSDLFIQTEENVMYVKGGKNPFRRWVHTEVVLLTSEQHSKCGHVYVFQQNYHNLQLSRAERTPENLNGLISSYRAVTFSRKAPAALKCHGQLEAKIALKWFDLRAADQSASQRQRAGARSCIFVGWRMFPSNLWVMTGRENVIFKEIKLKKPANLDI